MSAPGNETAEYARLVAAISTEPVPSLSALAAHAKKRAAREAIDALLSDRAPLYGALQSSEPKARKNAARLLGALARVQDAPALTKALFQETTLFVVPSLLLALGALAGTSPAAAEALGAYTPPEPKDETEQKHAAEIRAALQKALASAKADAPLPVRSRLDRPRALLLTAPAGFAPVLAQELAALGIAGEPDNSGVRAVTDDLAAVFRARCLQEALLPVGLQIPIDPAQIARAAGDALTRPYRVELRGYAGDRAAFIRAVVEALGGGDNPSRYADELRVECAKGGCDVYIRPCSVPDERFAYRRRAIPASIHPALAACIARYALSFAPSRPLRVLDPLCGSGTLLFELEKAAKPAALLGVDHAESALAAARENARLAHSRAQFVKKDILRFSPREPFDLVLANMPFGNRVGTHESNEPLYRGFIRLLPQLLAPDGAALLYTMEHRLLADCLRREPALRVAAARATEAGGLNPRVTVVRRAPVKTK